VLLAAGAQGQSTDIDEVITGRRLHAVPDDQPAQAASDSP
jgi:hypothetical protein